jgi:hypothetical protein
VVVRTRTLNTLGGKIIIEMRKGIEEIEVNQDVNAMVDQRNVRGLIAGEVLTGIESVRSVVGVPEIAIKIVKEVNGSALKGQSVKGQKGLKDLTGQTT